MRKAFILGLKDGFNEPYDLGMGMTWPNDQGKNEAYDRGVNLGQFLGRILKR